MQVAEQPSLLAGGASPSSHCSVPPTMPSPHVVSILQVALQPSPAVVLSSSHCSTPPRTPSPHTFCTQLPPPCGQTQPVSTLQRELQPSPLKASPSSQVSEPAT